MTGHRLKDKIPLVILLSAIILAAVIRLRLLNIPLERDEGEYAYMAQLLQHGFPPYVKAYTMKFPGIYPLYSFIMTIFGQTIAGIHLGLTIVNAATTVMIFLLAKKLFDPHTGAFAGASFAVLSLGKSVLGLAANAEHFVIFFVSAGMIVMLKALGSSGRGLLFLSGVLLGIGVAIKQHSIFFVIFAALYVVWHISTQDIPRSKCVSRAIAYLVSGAVLPMFLICFAFTATGSFEKFWFWTVIYSREYLKGTPFIAGVRFFIERLGAASSSGLTLWFAAAAGAGILCRRITGRGSNVFTLSFAFFSFLALMPGFLFREHYFILVLPALSIFSGVAMRKLFDPSRFHPDPGGFRKSISAGLCLVLLCYPLMNERSIFFVSSPEDASRLIYGSNPFPEAVKIAEYLKKNIADDQSVAVFGSEPQIYFYLRKTAPTGYIYMYPLTEDQPYSLKMQEELRSDIERSGPDYLIFVNMAISWTEWLISKKDQGFFQWFDSYYKNNYEVMGVVNIISKEKTEYVWGEEAKAYSPKTPYLIYILKRKSALAPQVPVQAPV